MQIKRRSHLATGALLPIIYMTFISRPVSRVLSPPVEAAIIYLGCQLPGTSSDQPEGADEQPLIPSY